MPSIGKLSVMKPYRGFTVHGKAVMVSTSAIYKHTTRRHSTGDVLWCKLATTGLTMRASYQ